MKKIMLFILCLACVLAILTAAVEAKTLAPKGFYPSTVIVVKVNHKVVNVFSGVCRNAEANESHLGRAAS